jgi:hypothetical protein
MVEMVQDLVQGIQVSAPDGRVGVALEVLQRNNVKSEK